jgi:hypothetical protein
MQLPLFTKYLVVAILTFASLFSFREGFKEKTKYPTIEQVNYGPGRNYGRGCWIVIGSFILIIALILLVQL